jgi:hypothetical protein
LLVQSGAKLDVKDGDHNTPLHKAASHFPEYLLQLAGFNDGKRGVEDTKRILEATNKANCSVLTTLIIESDSRHFPVAKVLLENYGVSYDAFANGTSKWDGTPTALAITLLITGTSSSIAPIRFLLKLEPPPGFVCRPDGSTLLDAVVRAWISGKLKTAGTSKKR